MKRIALILYIATLLSINASALSVTNDCPEIKVTATISNTTGGKNDGEIVLSFEKANENYTFFLFASETGENQLKITDPNIKGLKRGVYNLYVQDKKGCTKRLIITIN